MLDPTANQGDYVIGPQDKLNVRVFEVKDLSTDEEVVDATGQIELPLIGRVTAAGKTTQQLQDEIAQRLGDRYLQSPQVSVAVLGLRQSEGDGGGRGGAPRCLRDAGPHHADGSDRHGRRAGGRRRPAQGGGDPRD